MHHSQKKKRPLRVSAAAALAIAMSWAGIASADTAQLWGTAGELWKPGQPLVDFSLSGYKQSAVPPPTWTSGVNIRDFGAKGDGVADDTPALIKAIAACPPNGRVLLPAGAYVINDLIEVNKSSVVIAGEGVDRTSLVFPKFLVDLHPRPGRTTTGLATSLWSWSGGFIEFNNGHDVGIEDLTFQFPEIPYAGHFLEKGSNGINFQGVHDAWARRLRFLNADSGIFVVQSNNVTVRNIEFNAYAGRGVGVVTGATGHHALDFVTSTLCLADQIQFKFRLFHELGIEHGANGNVYSRCTGPDLAFDHHEPDVFGNLWTDIDVGQGQNVWTNNVRGSTKNEVYWNIRSQIAIPYPPPALLNVVVGMTGPGAAVQNPAGPWVEVIAPDKLQPPNIFIAELEKRIGVSAATAALAGGSPAPAFSGADGGGGSANGVGDAGGTSGGDAAASGGTFGGDANDTGVPGDAGLGGDSGTGGLVAVAGQSPAAGTGDRAAGSSSGCSASPAKRGQQPPAALFWVLGLVLACRQRRLARRAT
jgi:hypothetical protein